MSSEVRILRLLQVMAVFPLLLSCNEVPTADLIVYNGFVYTADSNSLVAQAVAINNGIITYVGDNESALSLQTAITHLIDAKGHFVMPGLIEGHGHLGNLGYIKTNLNLLQTESWHEILDSVTQATAGKEPGTWITGRGWHQEKWRDTLLNTIDGYPYHHALSAISPDHPVLLTHASGHSVFANAKAMAIAGITNETPDPAGGKIVRDAQGNAIGVFEENATLMIEEVYEDYLANLPPRERDSMWVHSFELAQAECLKYGITSFQDAGSTFEEIDRYLDMANRGLMKIRLWTMIAEPLEKFSREIESFPLVDAGNGHFTCRAAKLWIDGALGSYGAWLLQPYDDSPEFYGQNTLAINDVKSFAQLCARHGLQLCVHAIGDRANREVLDIFERELPPKDDYNGARWRIEHAQHLDPADIPRFAELGVIASIQAIHCTSDAPFVEKRLGALRARQGAYVWRSLLDAGAVVANGTDVPVENINPFECIYASVTRKRLDTGLEFYPEQSMTRAEALHSYTVANAFAAFEEEDKGTLSAGKYGDLVILSQNLLECPDDSIPRTEVLLTIIGGEVVYNHPEYSY